MIFCFVCHDGADAATLRQTHLQAHLDHIETVLDRMPVAGPVPGGEDAGYRGSIVMIEAETEQEARDLFNRDPYAKAAIWDKVEVYPFKAVAGRWVGGKTW